ncbi:asparaginase [Advenella mimigardefordensis]|uniref:Putative L-asparaginase n=1 Tax=Advenella mimigardefordensis (strain DSM 17166 / LMG 22922 / DPN7) TaxID=1247726 RepID=W0PI53_ADVMD|nr:asparaginase [Advenella mimigardefordensis]AHG64608.1 putative L-asparaginase [Advenella mimigardefordensis DPN7]
MQKNSDINIVNAISPIGQQPEPSEVAAKPKIALIGAGGTISTRSTQGSLDLVNYMTDGVTMHVDELVQALPQVHAIADIVAVKFRAVSSTSIAFEEWKALTQTVDQIAATQPDVDGVVILHGTATMEETAYMLHLTCKVNIPIVLVGAQRPLSALSSDAPLNLLNAVRVAGHAQTRGMGVLVCLNDEIHAAREVTKASTARLHAFRSPDFGIIGQIDAGEVAFYRQPLRRWGPNSQFDIRDMKQLPRVDIAYAYAGDDGAVIRALVNTGAKGIVIAAFAGGRLSTAQTSACREAQHKGVVIVLSTRAGSGKAMIDAQLQSMGMVAADNLNPQKARILLALSLSQTNDPEQLKHIFASY